MNDDDDDLCFQLREERTEIGGVRLGKSGKSWFGMGG